MRTVLSINSFMDLWSSCRVRRCIW